MSNINQDDWRVPLMTGTFSPSHGTVSKSARTISIRSPSGEMQEVTEEWIIPGLGPVPASGRTVNCADTPPETPSSAQSPPESFTKPEWATPIDEGFIHPEGYTTKILGADSILASRLADAKSQPDVSKHSISIPTPKGDIKLEIKDSDNKTPPPIPGRPPNTPSKQAGIKTSPSTPEPPPHTPSQRSIGTQTCVKAPHPPGYLPPPNCGHPASRTVKFVDEVEVIPDGSFEPGPSATNERKRPPFHRRPTPANLLNLVPEIKVLEHIMRELDSSKDGAPPAPPSVQPGTPKEVDDGVSEHGVETRPPSPGPPPNTQSGGLRKDGTPPPSSPPPNIASNKLSNHGTPPPRLSVPPSASVKRAALITDFFSTIAKDPSPTPPSCPPANTPSKDLPKGGGGGETPPPPSPPPNSPTELSKDGTSPPQPSPPPHTRSKEMSRPGTPRLSLINQYGDGEPFNPAKPKPMMERNLKLCLLDYTSDDDYPSPDPGSESPITPLWLEMKTMVDKFIFKTEEEEANRSIARRPESIPLAPSELIRPNVTIVLRVDEQGEVRVGLKGGAKPRDAVEGEVSSGPFNNREVELNTSIADEIQKIARHFIVRYEEVVAAGELKTAWERDQKAIKSPGAAAIQAAKDAGKDKDRQYTSQAIGSFSHVHLDSIE